MRGCSGVSGVPLRRGSGFQGNARFGLRRVSKEPMRVRNTLKIFQIIRKVTCFIYKNLTLLCAHKLCKPWGGARIIYAVLHRTRKSLRCWIQCDRAAGSAVRCISEDGCGAAGLKNHAKLPCRARRHAAPRAVARINRHRRRRACGGCGCAVQVPDGESGSREVICRNQRAGLSLAAS